MKSTYVDDVMIRVTLGDVVIGLHATEKQAQGHVDFIAAQGRRAYFAKPSQGGRIGKRR